MERPIFWGTLLKLVNKYRTEAEQCLASGSYFAGLVSVRAALEAVLVARYLLHLYDCSEGELSKYGLRIDKTKDLIEKVSVPFFGLTFQASDSMYSRSKCLVFGA